MKISHTKLIAAALLTFSSLAVAQTPPADPQTQTDQQSPTTKGTGAGVQPADPAAGQKPPTDPASKEQTKEPAAGAASGASTGEQGADATPGQKPATDPQSKEKQEGPAAE